MNDTLSKVFIFAIGGAIGAAVAWKILKDKYERLANEEIESVREYYANRNTDKVDHDDAKSKTNEVKNDVSVTDHTTIREYAAKLAEGGYTDYTEPKPERKEADNLTKPYVITPEEFGDSDYETISLTYYSDGTLADEIDEPVEDVDAIVGSDSLTRFGEYEDDAVFVRNDSLKADYEILLDNRKYSDVVNVNPYRSEE